MECRNYGMIHAMLFLESPDAVSDGLSAGCGPPTLSIHS